MEQKLEKREKKRWHCIIQQSVNSRGKKGTEMTIVGHEPSQQTQYGANTNKQNIRKIWQLTLIVELRRQQLRNAAYSSASAKLSVLFVK